MPIASDWILGLRWTDWTAAAGVSPVPIKVARLLVVQGCGQATFGFAETMFSGIGLPGFARLVPHILFAARPQVHDLGHALIPCRRPRNASPLIHGADNRRSVCRVA